MCELKDDDCPYVNLECGGQVERGHFLHIECIVRHAMDHILNKETLPGCPACKKLISKDAFKRLNKTLQESKSKSYTEGIQDQIDDILAILKPMARHAGNSEYMPPGFFNRDTAKGKENYEIMIKAVKATRAYNEFMAKRNQDEQGTLDKRKRKLVGEAKNLLEIMKQMRELLRGHAGRLNILN